MKGLWLKRVLVPLWVLELAWLVYDIALASPGPLSDSFGYHALFDPSSIYTDDNGILSRLFLAGAAVCIILDLTTISLLVRNRLNPLIYLLASCSKTLFAFLTFMYHVAFLAMQPRKDIALNSYFLIYSGPLLLANVGQLIYGSIIVHRTRKALRYTGRSGFSDEGDELSVKGHKIGLSCIFPSIKMNNDRSLGDSQYLPETAPPSFHSTPPRPPEDPPSSFRSSISQPSASSEPSFRSSILERDQAVSSKEPSIRPSLPENDRRTSSATLDITPND